MSAGALTPRDRWTLAAGVAICGSIIGIGRGLPAFRVWEGAQFAAAAEAVARVQRVEVASRLGSAMESGATRARAARAALDSLTLAGNTPAEAAATLSLLLGAYADSAGVRIVSSAVRSDTAFSRGFASARVRLTAVSDIEGAMVLLEQVESGLPILAVREFLATRGDAAAGGVQTLRIEMTVEALVHKVAPAEGDAREDPPRQGATP